MWLLSPKLIFLNFCQFFMDQVWYLFLLCTGMNLGVKLGMDPKILAGIVNTSSGRCWSSDTYNPVPGMYLLMNNIDC